jgi:hypothetical protein
MQRLVEAESQRPLEVVISIGEGARVFNVHKSAKACATDHIVTKFAFCPVNQSSYPRQFARGARAGPPTEGGHLYDRYEGR